MWVRVDFYCVVVVFECTDCIFDDGFVVVSDCARCCGRLLDVLDCVGLFDVDLDNRWLLVDSFQGCY